MIRNGNRKPIECIIRILILWNWNRFGLWTENLKSENVVGCRRITSENITYTHYFWCKRLLSFVQKLASRILVECAISPFPDHLKKKKTNKKWPKMLTIERQRYETNGSWFSTCATAHHKTSNFIIINISYHFHSAKSHTLKSKSFTKSQFYFSIHFRLAHSHTIRTLGLVTILIWIFFLSFFCIHVKTKKKKKTDKITQHIFFFAPNYCYSSVRLMWATSMWRVKMLHVVRVHSNYTT